MPCHPLMLLIPGLFAVSGSCGCVWSLSGCAALATVAYVCEGGLVGLMPMEPPTGAHVHVTFVSHPDALLKCCRAWVVRWCKRLREVMWCPTASAHDDVAQRCPGVFKQNTCAFKQRRTAPA
jgi:hypothetical protein